MSGPGKVGTVARLLGFAGLLPQTMAIAAIAYGRAKSPILAEVALFASAVYSGTILSFLGGMWWALAMKRETGQGKLVARAILPSLATAALFPVLVLFEAEAPWILVAFGSAIILTLLVDRHLATTGEAPVGWMALRVPLSLGLGVLTITAGVLFGLR